MRTAKEYREIASTRCEAQSGTLALIYLVVGLISGLANGFGILIIGPLMMGFSMVIVNNYNNRKVEVSQVFDGFNDFVKNLVLGLLHTIYVFLWSLLFLIPGIVKSYSYAMSYYIAGLISKLPIQINGFEWTAISFPEFEDLMKELGGE